MEVRVSEWRGGLVIRVKEGGSRMNASLVEQSRGSKVWFAIQGNVLGDSIDNDTHHENTG